MNEHSHDRRGRSRMLLAGIAAIAMLAALLPGSIGSASPLGASDFDATDGNLLLDDSEIPGNTDDDDVLDWENVAGLDKGIDASKTSTDNSYSGGVKQDTVCPAFSTGSIPPNKDDLTRLYVASEKLNGDVYLYLGWEREPTTGGSAHMGFEFNQAEDTTDGNCPGGTIPKRTAGDMLVVYDFEGGQDPPNLAILSWLTTTAGNTTAQCEANNSLPCWGLREDLDGTIAEGAVNTFGPVTDPIGPNAPRTVATNAFGEAAINLSEAGVFPANECVNFGRAHLSSRSSGNSFKAQLKDFIAPIDVDITNCQSLTIEKQDDAGNPLNGSTFALYEDIESPGVFLDANRTYSSTDFDEITAVADDPLTESATTLTIADDIYDGVVDVPFFVHVDDEVIEVTAVSVAALTVVRGRQGTTAAEHELGAPVQLGIPGDDEVATVENSSTLDGAVTASATSLLLEEDGGDAFPAADFYVKVGDEIIRVASRSDDTLTVATNGRGALLSTAATHADNSEVSLVAACSPFSSDPDGDPEAEPPVDPVPATCDISNLLFGVYWVVEVVTPAGYLTADPIQITVNDEGVFLDDVDENEDPVDTIVVTDNRAPVNVRIEKDDDAGADVAICRDDADDNLDITEDCVEFSLHDRESTTLTSAVEVDDEAIAVGDTSIFAVDDEVVVHGASLSNAETMTVDSIGTGTLSVTRGDATLTHPVGSIVSRLSNLTGTPASCDPVDADEAATGECTFSNILPGDYWIVEDMTNLPGHAPDPSLPKAITIEIGDADHSYTFVNDRLYNVIVLVCRASDDTLVASDVTFEDDTQTSLDTGELPSELDEQDVCALEGARFEDVHAGLHDGGDADNSVLIPAAPEE